MNAVHFRLELAAFMIHDLTPRLVQRAISTYFAERLPEVKMAKYGKAASKNVESTMRRKKKGTLKSSSGRKVTSRKQAIAIALSEARAKGAKVPPRKSARKSSRKTSKKK